MRSEFHNNYDDETFIISLHQDLILWFKVLISYFKLQYTRRNTIKCFCQNGNQCFDFFFHKL